MRVFCCFIRLDSWSWTMGLPVFTTSFCIFCIKLNLSDGMYMSSQLATLLKWLLLIVLFFFTFTAVSTPNEKHEINLQLNHYRTRRALGKRLKLRLRCGTSPPVIRTVTVNLNNCQTVSHLMNNYAHCRINFLHQTDAPLWQHRLWRKMRQNIS